MYETFVALLAAHLLSDFVLQTDWMVANKGRLRVLLSHVAIVGFSAAAALGARSGTAWLAILLIVGTHLGIDYIKVKVGDSLKSFAFDQLAHLVVIGAIAFFLPRLSQEGVWSLMPGDAQAHYYAFLTYGSGLVAAVPLGGILVKKAIAPFAASAQASSATAAQAAPSTGTTATVTPQNAGRYIGWLERALTLGFILTSMPQGVGFLLAAKSVLRIGDLKDPTDRSHAEYIIIGTFLSFGWALMIAMMTAGAVTRWTV
jgi:hypothetical protein